MTRPRRLLDLILLVATLSACRGAGLPEPIDLVLPRASTGEPYSFASHRGEVLMVFFFSTWCIPCQAMEPFVAEAARAGSLEGFDVVGVGLDVEGRATIAPYVAVTRPPYPVVVGGGPVARGQSPFGKIPELPAVLFLDRDGRPSSSISGVASTETLLRRAREVRRR